MKFPELPDFFSLFNKKSEEDNNDDRQCCGYSNRIVKYKVVFARVHNVLLFIEYITGMAVASDQVSKKGVVLVYLGKINTPFVHVVQQCFIIMLALQFYAYQCRTCFFIGLLHVFKTCNIVCSTQHIINKF